MNESSVMFWQVMLVLQIRLAAGISGLAAGMVKGLKCRFLVKRKKLAERLESPCLASKLMKGEQV